MNLENRISRIEKNLNVIDGGLCRCTVNGSRMELWEQSVDGTVDKPLSEPVRTGEAAETVCSNCGLETEVIQVCVVKNQPDRENVGVLFPDGKMFGGIDYDLV